ncbi:hypothetical protein KNP414_04246 [Paenibacillus mucilaginosus KNP414]|uniref:Uncharacterized protein n=1 Tax=Paenibacillus mucilaginosus (strain KNP414) TaxID=1036673 RepID=F8FHS1_PAEMK|nr:hypothetical protein KNP414_04246 [Paenibacillus mucilaginosus KNP414]
MPLCHHDAYLLSYDGLSPNAFWDRSEQFGFTTEAYSLDEALQAAAEEAARPVILSDTGEWI